VRLDFVISVWHIELLFIVFLNWTFILLCSLYLCMFSDNHVTHYMGANDVAGGVG